MVLTIAALSQLTVCELLQFYTTVIYTVFFERSPSLLLLTAQLEMVCSDTILTSGGSARGGYLEVRSAARHKQHATEQLFTKSYTNDLAYS